MSSSSRSDLKAVRADLDALISRRDQLIRQNDSARMEVETQRNDGLGIDSNLSIARKNVEIAERQLTIAELEVDIIRASERFVRLQQGSKSYGMFEYDDKPTCHYEYPVIKQQDVNDFSGVKENYSHFTL